jgi:hypothetical protein
MKDVKKIIQNALETESSIQRKITPQSLSDRGRKDLRKNIFEGDGEITSISITYRSERTDESLAYMNISYTSDIAYLSFIHVYDTIQNYGIATKMIEEDLIPYCLENLEVSTICGVAKAEEMNTVFKKTEFEEENKGTYYYP